VQALEHRRVTKADKADGCEEEPAALSSTAETLRRALRLVNLYVDSVGMAHEGVREGWKKNSERSPILHAACGRMIADAIAWQFRWDSSARHAGGAAGCLSRP
jgi:hypothetical protein